MPGSTEAASADLLGLELVEVTEEGARARIAVAEHHRQPMGLVHGGVFACVADSIATLATARAVDAEGRSAYGLVNQAAFMRPITRGTIHATARRRHRGRTTWVWEVEIADDDGRLCALVRLTVAIR